MGLTDAGCGGSRSDGAEEGSCSVPRVQHKSPVAFFISTLLKEEGNGHLLSADCVSDPLP